MAALESCAGSPERFFYAHSASEIHSAFEDVGKNLFDIRLLK